MALTLGDIRNRVREIMDIDQSDLSDVLIDMWANEAVTHTIAERTQWPHLETTWDLTTVAAQSRYLLSGLTPTPRDVSSVVNRSGVQMRLNWIGTDTAEATYFDDLSGSPTDWRRFGGYIVLHPVPDQAYQLELVGWREIVEMAAAGDEPDLPSTLHTAIPMYVVAKAYAAQEDQSLSSYWFQQFAGYVETVSRDEARAAPTAPLVMNGGRGRMSDSQWLRRVSGIH